MGATSCVLKCILGLVNTVFLLIGLAISAVGGILLALANNQGFSSFVERLIKDIIKNIGIVPADQADLLKFDFSGILMPAGVVILIFGLVVLGVSIVGYVGLSCSTIVLKVYFVIILVILIIQIVLVAVFFSGGFNNLFRSTATDVIETKYVGLTDGNIYSVAPNIIMSQLKCCGLNNYLDFHSSSSWVRNVTLEYGNSGKRNVTLETPEVCCKVDQNDAAKAYDCATNPNNDTSNFENGCWHEVISKLSPHKTAAILISVAILVVQAILIIFVLIIVCDD